MNDQRAIEILARTIWGEARSEGVEGMKAITCVVLNRVSIAQKRGGHFWWGHDIQSVCLKPWQFSCWKKNDPNRQKVLAVTSDDPHFFHALKIAKEAITCGLEDMTLGSDHYHTVYIHPFWSKEEDPQCQIGRHLFYKLIE